MSDLRKALLGLVDEWETDLRGEHSEPAAQTIRYHLDEVGRALADSIEDAPGSEPKATVVVVRDGGGREHRYAAPNFGMLHDGTLVIGDKTTGEDLRVDAARAPGHWASVHKDGVFAPDVTATKLRIAMDALRTIGATVLEAGDKRRVPVGTARDALEQIAELDL